MYFIDVCIQKRFPILNAKITLQKTLSQMFRASAGAIVNVNRAIASLNTNVYLSSMARHGRRQGGGPCPPVDFIHVTNIIDRGLTVLFFCLFSVFPSPLEIFLPTPLWASL